MTSHDVIYRVRKILNIKRVGHAGTLDPLAEGVLPVGVGNAARLLDFLPDEKEYIAGVKFGYVSDTYDREGKIEKVSDSIVDKSDFEIALKDFEGDIIQKPPIYSAVKVNGKKLYDYARKGSEVEIPERKIRVDLIKLLEFDEKDTSAKILIKCSKGTYIRSIINDLGLKLKIGAYMTSLVRTLSSGMNVNDSVKIDEISQASLISPNSILKFPEYKLDDNKFKKVKNGNSINVNLTDGYIFLTFDGQIISLANVSDNVAYSKKVFVN